VTRRGSRSRTRAALAAAAVAAVLVAVTIAGGGDDGREVRAEFAQTNHLRVGDPVRVDGVQVGRVDAIALRPDTRTAIVTMRLTDPHVRVTRAARADLRWGTLLGGNLSVALSPGSPSFGGDASSWIPKSQTSSQVEFDDLLQIFDGATPAAVRSQLEGARVGLSDERAMQRLLPRLAPTLTTLEQGLDPLLGRQPDDLRELVAATSRTVAGLGRDDRHLRRLVGETATTLRATASAGPALARAVASTPSALAEIRRFSTRLRRTLGVLDPLARDLRAPARRLAPALAQTEPTLRSATSILLRARPLLRALSPSIAALATASRDGLSFMKRLDPTLTRASSDLLPWLKRTDPDTQRSNAEMIGPTASAAAGAGSEFDGEGYWLRFAPSGGERLALSAPCQTFLTDPSVAEKVRCDALEQTLAQILGGTP
jgi:phospholipid/cholesterol/gamma-HCH transport system substrate-binding protein